MRIETRKLKKKSNFRMFLKPKMRCSIESVKKSRREYLSENFFSIRKIISAMNVVVSVPKLMLKNENMKGKPKSRRMDDVNSFGLK